MLVLTLQPPVPLLGLLQVWRGRSAAGRRSRSPWGRPRQAPKYLPGSGKDRQVACQGQRSLTEPRPSGQPSHFRICADAWSALPPVLVSRRALRRKGRVDNNKPHGGRDPALTSSQCLSPRTPVPARSREAGAAATPDSHPAGPSGLAGYSAAGRRRFCRLAAPQGRLVAAAEARAAAEDGAGDRRLCCCRGRRRRCRVSAALFPSGGGLGRAGQHLTGSLERLSTPARRVAAPALRGP